MTGKSRILVIDDDQNILEYVREILGSEYDVHAFNFCPDIMEVVLKTDPELALIDLKIPGNDGYRMCSAIRNEDKLKDLPVILLTGVDLRAIAHNYKKVAANDYILKPFTAATLLEKINKLISFKKSRPVSY